MRSAPEAFAHRAIIVVGGVVSLDGAANFDWGDGVGWVVSVDWAADFSDALGWDFAAERG